MQRFIQHIQTTTRSSKGVTLIELLIVISVISILAMVVLTAINPSQRIKEAQDTQIRADLAAMRNSIEAYAAANQGTYPSTSATPGWWCQNCSASWAVAQGANLWIPQIVAKGYIKRLPVSPLNGVGSGYSGCDTTNSGYIYQSDGTGYKLIAHCTPKTGVNNGNNQPPSEYCTTTSGGWPSQFDDSGLVLTPGGNPAHKLKSLVDPKRYTYAMAVYSRNYTCL